MKPVLLNAIIPKYFGSTSISLVMLKSYALDKFHREGRYRDLELRVARHYCEEGEEAILERILADGSDFLAFAVYPWNHALVRSLVSRIKSVREEAWIVLGGPSVTYDASRVLAAWDGADVVVRGPGEETFSLLLDRRLSGQGIEGVPNVVYRNNGAVLEAPVELNFRIEDQEYELLTEDLEDLDIVNYDTSRGCTFQCGYCAWNVDGIEPKGFRFYPMSKVGRDLEKIFKLDALEKLLLNDSNITIREERCIEVFRLIRSLNERRRLEGKNQVFIVLDLNPQYFTDRIIDELKRMHIGVLGFGLQTIDSEVLDIAHRKLDLERYVGNLRKLAEKSGIQIIIEFIFGLPGDTMEKFRKNLEFFFEELDTFSFISFRFLLLPGSPFWREKEHYGIVHSPEPPYDVLSTPTFSAEEMDYADWLSSWFEIFFSIFRSVKKTVDASAKENGLSRVAVYEALFERLSKNYEWFFDKGWKQEHTYYYIEKIRERENAAVRQGILADSRRVLKDVVKTLNVR